jgi:ankyrin repeat protein
MIRNRVRFANRSQQLERKYLRQAQRILRQSIENEQIEQVQEILSADKFIVNNITTSLIENEYFYSLKLGEDDADVPSMSSFIENDNLVPMEISSDLDKIGSKVDNTLSTSSSKTKSSLSSISLRSIDSVKKTKSCKTIRKIDWSKFYLDKNGHDNALHYAVRLDKTCLIDILLDSGHFSLEDRNQSEEHDTPLCIACDTGCLNTAKILIARGANVNYENSKLKTPLILSTELIYPYDLNMCKMLLKNGAQVNKVTQNLNTCLLSASKFGNLDLIKLLINANANLNAQFNDGATCLMRACYYNNKDVAKYLLDHGALVEMRNVRQETASYIASFRGNYEILQMLVEDYKADKNAEDKDGDTPLSVACYEDKPKIIEFLLEQKAYVKTRGIRGDSVIHISSSNCSAEIVQKLIEHGADVDALNDDRETPLHIIARHSRVEIMQLVLKYATNLDQSSIYGNKTAFKTLIEIGQVEKLKMAICLIKAGCDVNKSFNKVINSLNLSTNDDEPQFRSIFAMMNDSPFDNLFRISRTRMKFYQQTHAKEINENRYEDPIYIVVSLMELLLKAGYKVSASDYKFYKESWICANIKSVDAEREINLDNLFKFYLNRPASLKDLCKFKVRSLMKKPVEQSIEDLCDFPKQLKSYLNLEYV